MRAFYVVALFGLMMSPAYSQGLAPTSSGSVTPGFRLNEPKEYTDDEKARMKANEDAAKAARAKLPDSKASSDPWAGARAAETSAPKAAKTTAAKPKAPPQ